MLGVAGERAGGIEDGGDRKGAVFFFAAPDKGFAPMDDRMLQRLDMDKKLYTSSPRERRPCGTA